MTIGTSTPAPKADAGLAHIGAVKDLVEHDGAATSDPDGDLLSYAWSLTSRPAGSSAALSNANTPNPVFVADRAGEYVATLVVSDGELDSEPDSVRVSTANSAPVAEAGAEIAANVGDIVELDGGRSTSTVTCPRTCGRCSRVRRAAWLARRRDTRQPDARGRRRRALVQLIVSTDVLERSGYGRVDVASDGSTRMATA